METLIGINQRAREYGTLRHRAIWEDHYGKIPENKVIHHIDGNKTNNRIENLECLTIKEHGQRHLKPNRKRIYFKSGAVKVIKIENLTK